MSSSATAPIKNQNPQIKNTPPAPLETGNPILETSSQSSVLSTHPSLLCPASLTLLLGDPGAGKSLLAIDLAARLSRGDNSLPFPILPPDCLSPPIENQIKNQKSKIENPLPASSILLSMEDSTATLTDRLSAAGADLHHIALSATITPNDSDDLLHPQSRHAKEENPLIPVLRQLVQHLARLENPRLLILDPLPAFLATADSSSAGLIRALLRPLLLLADRHNLAILGISHLNKSTHKKNPLHRAIGSLAYTALARSVYLLTTSLLPSVPQCLSASVPSPPRLLTPLKNNLAPLTHALAFSLTPNATLAWHPSPIPLPSSDPHSVPSTQSSALELSQLDFACEFLQKSLENGPIPTNNLIKEARSIGISVRTLERARFRLGIPCHKDSTANQWLLHPPSTKS